MEIARVKIFLTLHDARIKNKIINETKLTTAGAIKTKRVRSHVLPSSLAFCCSSKRIIFSSARLEAKKYLPSSFDEQERTCLNEHNGVTRTKIRRHRGSALFTRQRNILMRSLRPGRLNAQHLRRVCGITKDTENSYEENDRKRIINRYSGKSWRPFCDG